MPKQTNRGGLRTPGPGKRQGRPSNEALGKPKRQKASVYLAPEVIAFFKAFADKRGYPGWGYAVEEAAGLLKKIDLT